MKQLNIFLSICIMIIFTGCGGGSSDKTTLLKGQFFDAFAVKGLTFKCEDGSPAITNDAGEFTCATDDRVTFSLGGYELGSTMATEDIVTPDTLYPDDENASKNVSQLIQTLDTDPSDTLIEIPENFSELDDVNTTPADENFDTVMEDTLMEPLVSEDEVDDSLDEAKIRLLLGGKTLFLVQSESLERLVFNNDVSSAAWDVLDGSDIGTSGTSTYTLSGDYLISEDGEYFTVAGETDDYILVDVSLSEGGTVVEQVRLYADQTKAQAYFDTLKPEDPIVTLLGGKTLFLVQSDSLERLVFNADVTSATWSVLDGVEAGTSGTDTYTLSGEYLITEDGEYFTVAEETDDYILANVSLSEGGAVVEQVRLYADQTKAQAYYDSLQPDLATFIVGETRYFANSQGGIGNRSYATDGSYTGTVGAQSVSGTYVIADDVLTINRTSPTSVTLILTYIGTEEGGLVFDITVNGGAVFQTISFATATERDNYVASQ